MQHQFVSTPVMNLVAGNRVDLASCPLLSNRAIAPYEFGIVSSVEQEAGGCVLVCFENAVAVAYPRESTLMVKLPHDVADREIKVRPVTGDQEWSVWKLSHNLSDRWGELNYYNAQHKPLELLETNQVLLEKLREQMVEEDTFIARKDGVFGILYEMEMLSESDGEEFTGLPGDHDQSANLRPAAMVVEDLKRKLALLAPQYPGAEFCVPAESEICNDRPAAWVFVPEGLLTLEQRNALGDALSSL
ncbi:hypothetical protein APB26_31935 [Pseudomonas aeruginosa]|uniref:hypothetical protein n=1 Tax=Pseudomonas aeruginosa TaxID=287 RepID=UPI00071B6A12|nr:hypothetical protein [Pseudomonas aeruginosa]KSQ21599.1 hypothetical protein APB26_31935 [Pseudomonas aeruginosa]RPV61268.1 hypothetical protein IPC838_18265 [Pseudomonas aeruginosa]